MMQEEGKKFFSIVTSTLERVSDILNKIVLNSISPITRIEKQTNLIELTKQLYINSIPLLDAETTEKLNYILEIKPFEKNVFENRGLGNVKNMGKEIFYDYELEIKLNKAISDIQIELKKKGYFK